LLVVLITRPIRPPGSGMPPPGLDHAAPEDVFLLRSPFGADLAPSTLQIHLPQLLQDGVLIVILPLGLSEDRVQNSLRA